MISCKTNNCDYYSTQDQQGFCSLCYRKEFNIPLLQNTILENSNLWVNENIHNNNIGDCISCDKKPNFIRIGEIDLYNKFNCDCKPSLCKKCLYTYKNCPLCNANAYYKLSRPEIEYLIMNNFDQKSFMKIILNIINAYNIKGHISNDNLIAPSKYITDAIENVAKKYTVNYETFNNAYTFAFDIWNIPEKVAGQQNTAYCYKSTMNDPPKTYKSFKDLRYGFTKFKTYKYEIQ